MSINDISSKREGDVELDAAFRAAKARIPRNKPPRSELPITGQWLRELGFKYHAIGKYFYMTTLNDVLLVEAKDSESDPDVQWFLSVVGGQIDPATYTDLAAMLTGRATRRDVEMIVGMCREQLSECEWSWGEDWSTSCGEEFVLNDDTDGIDWIKYCCFCGRKVRDVNLEKA